MQHKDEELMKRMLDAVEQYRIENNGVSPTTRELARLTGVSSASTSRYLNALEERGILIRNGVRNLETRHSKASAAPLFPLLGAIACGAPLLAEENIEAFIPMPEWITGKGDFFFLRAKGNSMINAGIAEKDLVLIRMQNTAEPGQIVVGLIDNEEATLKRYYSRPDEGTVILRPENDDFDDIIVDLTTQTFSIQGIAVKILKDLY